jgi:glycosyltransferase involved in cell wall biosynthesis
MKILFIHQNFPGQYRHLAAELANDPDNEVVFVTQRENVSVPNVRVLNYKPARMVTNGIHHYLAGTEAGILNAQQVVRRLGPLQKEGFEPDVMFGHNAWGETWYLKDLFPKSPLIGYFEFYYQAEGADVGFDPADPLTLDLRLKVRTRNLGNLMGLQSADIGQTPTFWQKSTYPSPYQDKLHVVHEGIDTEALRPDPGARLFIKSAGLTLSTADEVVTYVARNLEPYRGFPEFMRSLPRILEKRPKAQVVVVGGDETSYGRPPYGGGTWRQVMRDELGDSVDWSRIHFLGRIPYRDFVTVLQVSRVHVYLTYPFVLSWSALEAMACGCHLVASRTPPVEEVMVDGKNGTLVDFFDVSALSDAVVAALAEPASYQARREAARQTIVNRYDLRRICLPAQLQLIDMARDGFTRRPYAPLRETEDVASPRLKFPA